MNEPIFQKLETLVKDNHIIIANPGERYEQLHQEYQSDNSIALMYDPHHNLDENVCQIFTELNILPIVVSNLVSQYLIKYL